MISNAGDNDGSPNTPPTPRVRQRVRTLVGRQQSARNATRHGALSQQIVGELEEMEAYDELLNELENEYVPETATEYSLVQRLATLIWRERRLAKSEAQKLRQYECEIVPGGQRTPFPIEQQLLVGRYQTMLSNQITKTIEQIIVMKDARRNT
ncbi:hypothetical protein [Erythrobacter alti]|uniref:hypothetical protein n=1 Tax=Erythrobacter alti TaxID=1896145 RepID=UPI0030F4693C